MPTPFLCRPGCAACCIHISISSPLPGLPHGKPAGQRCLHLDAANRCGLWGGPDYPAVCRNYRPEPSYCGSSDAEAEDRHRALEKATSP